MKTNWISLPLDSVASIDYGTRVVQKKDGGSIYPVYGGGGETFRMDKFNRQDILVISRFAMSAQCTRFVRGPFFLNDSGLTVSTKSNSLSQAFLEKYLIAHNDDIYLMGKGMAQRNLDMPSFRKFIVSFPESVKEQQRIVDELDLLTGIIDKKNAQLRDLDALAQSIFYEMFGNIIANEKKWPFGRFADICAPRSSIKRASKSYLPSDSIEYIEISSIDNKRQKLTGTTAFIFSDAPSRAQQVVQYEDVLISMVRPNLKNIAVVDLDHNRLVASSGFCVLRANNRSNSSFIKSFIGTDAFTQYLMDRVTGANYPAVKEDDIKGCRIGVPPVDLQRQFAERVVVIERQKQLISSALDEFGSLLSGRMDLYFNE